MIIDLKIPLMINCIVSYLFGKHMFWNYNLKNKFHHLKPSFYFKIFVNLGFYVFLNKQNKDSESSH